MKFLVTNMLPVTIGNYLGGSLLVAGVNYLAYGTPSKKQEAQKALYGR